MNLDILLINVELETINIEHDLMIARKDRLQFYQNLVQVMFEELFYFDIFLTVTAGIFTGVLMVSTN